MYHSAAIHFLLRVERWAIHVQGKEHIFLFDTSYSHVPDDDDNDSSSLNQTTSALSEEIVTERSDGQGPKNRCKCHYPPNNRFGRYLINTVALLLILAIEGVYYVFHYIFSAKEREVFKKGWILEFGLMLPFMLSFCFAAPLHHALGYSNPSTPRQVCNERVHAVIHNKGAKLILNAFLVLTASYTMGDFLFFTITRETNHLTKFIFFLSILINIGTIYGSLVLTAMSVQVMLTRLSVVENENETEVSLDTTMPLTHTLQSSSNLKLQAGDSSPQREEQILRWLDAYQSIRADLHTVSENFGPRMVVGLFLFVVDNSSIIGTVYDELEDRLTSWETLYVLLLYASSALMLIITTSTLAYTTTECVQNIGPKLSVLAMRRTQNPQYMALANMFLLAPIRLSVGNFAFSPDISNTLALWFTSLFLLVLGLKAPE